jgi:hypothetical protein
MYLMQYRLALEIVFPKIGYLGILLRVMLTQRPVGPQASTQLVMIGSRAAAYKLTRSNGSIWLDDSTDASRKDPIVFEEQPHWK